MLKHLRSRDDWTDKAFGAEGLGGEGFTLIELLVVVIILGILAAVVVVAVGGTTGSSRRSACKTEAKSIKTAATAYHAADPTGDTWPNGLAALQSDPRLNPDLTGKQWLYDDPGFIDVTGNGPTAKPTLAWKAGAPSECTALPANTLTF